MKSALIAGITGQTLAHAYKARKLLDWKPPVSFEQMVNRMVDVQIARLRSRLGAGK